MPGDAAGGGRDDAGPVLAAELEDGDGNWGHAGYRVHWRAGMLPASSSVGGSACQPQCGSAFRSATGPAPVRFRND